MADTYSIETIGSEMSGYFAKLPPELVEMIVKLVVADPHHWLALKLTSKAFEQYLDDNTLPTIMVAHFHQLYLEYAASHPPFRDLGLTVSAFSVTDPVLYFAISDAKRSTTHVHVCLEFQRRHQSPSNLRCSECQRRRGRFEFPDYQAAHFAVTTPFRVFTLSGRRQIELTRICIICGDGEKHRRVDYSLRSYIILRKEMCFVCHGCKAAFPLMNCQVSGKQSCESLDKHYTYYHKILRLTFAT